MKCNLAGFTTELKFIDKSQFSNQIDNNCFFVIDEKLLSLFPEIFSHLNYYPFAAREEKKTLQQAENIFVWLKENKANRNSTLYAIGGGITTDLAGWVAATYMRGMKLINVPTTCIGMVDAAIGGKTALNFASSKNLLGSFYPAREVIYLWEFLSTLSENQKKDGKAEIIKTALLENGEMLSKIINIPSALDQDIFWFIKNSASYKLKLCAKDLRDQGERRKLNLGHSFAHLIESVTSFSISHGQAVAMGIILSLRLSRNLHMISPNFHDHIESLMYRCFGDDYLTLDQAVKKDILAQGEYFLNLDKKNDHSWVFVLFEDNKVVIKKGINWQQVKKLF